MNTTKQIQNKLEKEGIVALKETIPKKDLKEIQKILETTTKRKQKIPNKHSYKELHIPKKLLQQKGIITLLTILQEIQKEGTQVDIHIQEYEQGDYTLIHKEKENAPLLQMIYCIKGTGTEKTGGRRIYLNTLGQPTPINLEENTLIINNNTHIEYHEYQQKTIKKPITTIEITVR